MNHRRPNKVTENDADSSFNSVKQEEENREYVVKKILDKRKRYGKVEYLIKWKDFNDSENSWEPIKNLNCKYLIKQFEKKRKSMLSNSIVKNHVSLDVGPSREVEKIMDVTNCDGKIIFLIKYKGIEEPEVIKAEEANKLYPQVVINFYQETLEWKN
ncbi:heterochromatin protein 1-like [Rhopalosiphum maidis]|uniref:heterochromatin protein 1-like n=1 Tax=Rhopalosiphum maidis TaxID=43146 RepID=UPI000EFF730B|nr:heterochromatin protein 1-like [Rhopalosiphum maidis]